MRPAPQPAWSLSVYLKGLVKIPRESQSHALHSEGLLVQSPASGMVVWRCLCRAFPCFPQNTLHPHLWAQTAQYPTNSKSSVPQWTPGMDLVRQFYFWAQNKYFQGGRHASYTSDTVASLLHFERAIKKEKEVTTSVLLLFSPVGTLLLWTWMALLMWFSINIPGLNVDAFKGREPEKSSSLCREAVHVPPVKCLSPAWRLWAGGHWLHNRPCSSTLPKRHSSTYCTNYGSVCPVQRQPCAEWLNWHDVLAFM